MVLPWQHADNALLSRQPQKGEKGLIHYRSMESSLEHCSLQLPGARLPFLVPPKGGFGFIIIRRTP